MKRKLSRLLVALLIALNTMGAASALAAEVDAASIAVTPTKATDEIVIQRAEETTWVYREYNGWLQKRQWSNTYGRWNTEWINIRRL